MKHYVHIIHIVEYFMQRKKEELKNFLAGSAMRNTPLDDAHNGAFLFPDLPIQFGWLRVALLAGLLSAPT